MLDWSPRIVDRDGSILWVIDEYTVDSWMHTFTKLNKYCFLISEETEYLPYVNIVSSRSGATCSNLRDYITYYEKHGLVVSEERNNGDKKVYQLTDAGQKKLETVVTDTQEHKLKSCLTSWEDMSILLLLDEIYSSYPEYAL